MTQLHRLIWLTLLWAIALPATAAERLAVLELTGSAADDEFMLELSDQLRAGALQAARSSDVDLEVMTRERMAATLGDIALPSRQANEVCADSSASV